MNHPRRPHRRSALILLLVAAAFILTACGGRVSTTNWAGLSTDGRHVYLATGPSVLAYDVENQTQSWTYPEEPNATLRFYSAPSVEDGRVIFGDYGQSGGFFSPDVTVSVYALPDDQQGVPDDLWINETAATDKIVAPTLQVGDQVFVGTADNHILALDAASGEAEWDFETEHAIWGQPTYLDGVLYVASMDWSTYALDAASGTLLWQTKLNGALPSKPVLGDGLIYVSSFDGGVHALDIETGQERWKADAPDWVWGAPALLDGTIYFGDIQGNIFSVDALTGELLWTKTTGAPIQSAPVAKDGIVYFTSEVSGETPTGALTAYAAEDGRQLWQVPTPAPLYATPVIVGDETLVIALQGEGALLIGYDLETGNELWRYTPPAAS